MANDLNQCNFIGRLGADVETKFLPSGDPVANIRLAVGEAWKDQSGQKQEYTNWLTLVAFKRSAEIAQQYLSKGSRIQATCKVRVRQWQDQQGNNRHATEFVIQSFQMLDSANQGQQQNQGGQQAGKFQQQNQGAQGYMDHQARHAQQNGQGNQGQGAPGPGNFDDFDDEIPF